MKGWTRPALMILLLLCCLLLPAQAGAESGVIDEQTLERLDALADTALKKSKTPGLSVAVVTQGKVYLRSYGVADKTAQTTVSPDTLFELGSMSKAFTGLGILLLEQEGKIGLSDDVRSYLPWLTMNYHGTYRGERIDGEVPLTIGNFLYQTTGIPFQTIGELPEGGTDSMLEDTVRTLVGIELDFYPGTQYQYASINYDVLGLVIQTVSGMSYEDFIAEWVLKPLGLDDTYVGRQAVASAGQGERMAKGYKVQYLVCEEYDAPEYRGNTPAGYVISSARDMARWMQIQMGLADVPQTYRELIEASHVGDSTVASAGDYYYAAGWSVHIRGESLSHGGSNPNFSSMLQIDRDKQIGICVLANQNDNAAGYVSENLLRYLYGEELTKYTTHEYVGLDAIFTLVCVGAALLGLLYFVLTIKALIDIVRQKRFKEPLKKARVAGLALAAPIVVFYGFCLYYLPNILLSRIPWHAVTVWGSTSIRTGCVVAFVAGVVFFCYVLLTFHYPKQGEKNYVALVPLSLINGLASALIIFTINECFNRNLEYAKELLVYFIFAITFFVYTTKLVQGRMIVITNEIAYEKRMSMIERIMNSSFQAIERIGGSRIYSGLNNDTGAVAQIPGMVVGFASNLLTVIFCMAYLFTRSVSAFLASLGVIALNAALSLITSRIASKYWEKNRDIQDIYFGQMSDLVYGFKELLLSKLRRLAFRKDLEKYSRLSANLGKEASVKFLNMGLFNTLMYNSIYGVVVFLFPLLIAKIDVNGLRETLFMVFYLVGPFGGVVGVIPGITQIRVNLKRIDKLIEDLEEASCEVDMAGRDTPELPPHSSLCLKDVAYSYTVMDEEKNETVEFTLGPVNAVIRSGEITYITGGNGSGKSTLGKVITGMYQPQQRHIELNGKPCDLADLNALFSAVYSDFHLFPKLYGVEIEGQRDRISELLRIMRIDHKVEVGEDGKLNSQNLSAGQKKRLAFVVCCLDQKPFLLFDEWAAEQDPEFRQYFYTKLLPDLRRQGKGVLVITHDDRYFGLADQMIKLERGQVVPEREDPSLTVSVHSNITKREDSE